MQAFSIEIRSLIKKLCKGKTHMKFTVGTLVNGETICKMFDADGEIPFESYGYEIGSVTKSFVGLMLAKNIHEGTMSLDDPVSIYVDGLDASKYYPTLRRLVTHTAGYGGIPLTGRDYAKFIFNDIFKGSSNGGKLPIHMDLKKMTALLQNTPMEDKEYPWKYSNFGIGVLGYAIGVVSGKGYWDTMNDFLYNELGMEQTFTGITPDKILQGYDRKNQNIGNWEWSNDNYFAPAGDLRSTATDLLTYAKMNMNEEKPYMAMAHKKYADLSEEWGQGLGWLQDSNNHNIIYGMGGTGAFYSFLGIDKQGKVACVVLSNYLVDLKHTVGRAILKDLRQEAV